MQQKVYAGEGNTVVPGVDGDAEGSEIRSSAKWASTVHSSAPDLDLYVTSAARCFSLCLSVCIATSAARKVVD